MAHDLQLDNAYPRDGVYLQRIIINQRWINQDNSFHNIAKSLKLVRKKPTWIGHIMRTPWLMKDVIEGRMEG